MARTNKYTSVNFNDVFEKKINHSNPIKSPSSLYSSSSSSSSSPSTTTNPNKSYLATSRSHGGMLVLTRPSPKPQPAPQPQPSPQAPSKPDPISLRPLGRTGTSPSLSSHPPSSAGLINEAVKEVSSSSPKPGRFVPPHLRPGFVGREEKLESDLQKQLGFRPRELGHRPKSGGYEKIGRGGESDLVELSRPSSSGTRPSSS